MKTNICPICTVVSSVWLIMSAGVAWGYLTASAFLIPIALLMGGTVVGIAYLGERKYSWAAKNPQLWKSLAVLVGMFAAYILVSHISKLTVFVELIILITLAYLLFGKKFTPSQTKKSDNQLEKIEKQMEQCC